MTRTALAGATSPLRTSRLVAGEQSAPPNREALLMRTLINHPWLLDDWAEQIAEITFESTALSRLRDAILSIQVTENSLDRTTLASQLTVSGLDKVVNLVERANTHRSDRFCEPDAERAEVEAGWRHALALHERQSGLKRSLSAALQAFDREGSEDALARICEIKHLLAQDFDQEALDSSP